MTPSAKRNFIIFLACAVVLILASAILLTRLLSNPTSPPSPSDAVNQENANAAVPTPEKVSSTEWKQYRYDDGENPSFTFSYSPENTITTREEDSSPTIVMSTPETETIAKETLGERTDQVFISPRVLGSDLAITLLLPLPLRATDAFFRMNATSETLNSYIGSTTVDSRTGFQLIHSEAADVKYTLFENPDETWFVVRSMIFSWYRESDPKSEPYDTILQSITFLDDDFTILSPNGSETFSLNQSVPIRLTIGELWQKRLQDKTTVTEPYLIDESGWIRGHIASIDPAVAEVEWEPSQLEHWAGLDIIRSQPTPGKYKILLLGRERVDHSNEQGDYPVDIFVDGFTQYKDGKILHLRDGQSIGETELLVSDVSDDTFSLTK